MTKAVLWTAQDAQTATGGKTTGDWTVSGISIDSRKVTKGDLFIALKGPNFDGHTFAQAALDAGASAVMVDDATGITDPDTVWATPGAHEATPKSSPSPAVSVKPAPRKP